MSVNEKGSGAPAAGFALHTPGPWEAVQHVAPKDAECRWTVCAGDVPVAECEPVQTRHLVGADPPAAPGGGSGDYDLTLSECEANAKLIAAAPELADALEGLVVQLDGMRDFIVPDGGAESLLAARAALRSIGRQS